MSKKGVAPKIPPSSELSLRLFLGDTRDLILQLGEQICLPSRSSSLDYILTKMSCAITRSTVYIYNVVFLILLCKITPSLNRSRDTLIYLLKILTKTRFYGVYF